MHRLKIVSDVSLLEDDFVAVDVEISSRSPLRVCAIGAARFQAAKETASYRSLVRVSGRVRYGKIHGLTETDLSNAPPWPHVWKEVLQLVGDIQLFVAFNAEFDRGALLVMCGAHGLRPPPMRFVCAARMAEARLKARLDLATVVAKLGLEFPGIHHDPLADARAAAAVVLACSHPSPT